MKQYYHSIANSPDKGWGKSQNGKLGALPQKAHILCFYDIQFHMRYALNMQSYLELHFVRQRLFIAMTSRNINCPSVI